MCRMLISASVFVGMVCVPEALVVSIMGLAGWAGGGAFRGRR
jgi:hypothetical protein